ncbi:MAG TPA: hypothetical protein VFS21_09050 [Roseiflexaceae bacterium]|nr:hypothetical protein [Roseiflexaceae bacterium]
MHSAFHSTHQLLLRLLAVFVAVGWGVCFVAVMASLGLVVADSTVAALCIWLVRGVPLPYLVLFLALYRPWGRGHG